MSGYDEHDQIQVNNGTKKGDQEGQKEYRTTSLAGTSV